MHRYTIEEAEGLWESLYKLYNLKGTVPSLESLLNDVVQTDAPSLSINHLGSIDNPDGTITAQQIIYNDVLVFIITISTPDDYVTESPEIDWEQQLDILFTVRDLKNMLGMGNVLVATSEKFEDILMSVRMKIPFTRGQTINYCNLDFGHLYRFGSNDNYLMVMDLLGLKDERVSNLLFNNFPNILSLTLTIKENYRLFEDYKEQLSDIEGQLRQHNRELPTLNLETDPIMLAIRKDHVSELGKKTKQIRFNIGKCADQIRSRLTILNTVLWGISKIKDKIFIDDIKKFQNYNNIVNNWLETNVEIFNNISNGIEEYINEISKLIDALNKREERISPRPKLYEPTPTTDETFSYDKSPYKNRRSDFNLDREKKVQLLESIPLEWCSSYILLEPKPNRSLKIFSELINNQFLCLGLTHEDRENIIKRFNFEDTSIYQIDMKSGEYFVPPVLSKISQVINEFITDNIHSIIYLDGIDYLIANNDFNRVLKFNNNIKESIVLNDSILIISLSNQNMSKNEFAMFMENSVDITNLDVDFEDIQEW